MSTKTMSIFIDESGDFGFIKDASKYYLITLVFHDQKNDITTNLDKMKNEPVFHAGPIIRREYPFENDNIIDRKKYFQKFFMFTLGLPIKARTFSYDKKIFGNDSLKMEGKMVKDIYNFFSFNFKIFNEYKLIVYYDNGQHTITKIINSVLSISGLNYEFKKKVQPSDYRLFQVADFISTIRLLEIKMNCNEQSESEKLFIDKRHLKKNYIKVLNKKLI